MTDYELKKETSAFVCGYWDGFLKIDRSHQVQSPSERVDYARGYLAGKQDRRR